MVKQGKIDKTKLVVPELDKNEVKKFEGAKKGKKGGNAKASKKDDDADMDVDAAESSDDEADKAAIKAAKDSVDPANNPDVAAAQEKKKMHKNSMNLMENRIKLTKEERDKRGVIYVGHLPIGFCEPQMKKFFSQFGRVTRMILKRSIKTGRPKGYAFVEFELKQIAEIVAGAMDKYMLFGRTLEIKKIPQGTVPPGVFKKCNKKIVVTERRNQKTAKKQHNKVVKKADEKEKKADATNVLSSRQVRNRNKQQEKQKAVLADMGLSHLGVAMATKPAVAVSKMNTTAPAAAGAKKSKGKKKA